MMQMNTLHKAHSDAWLESRAYRLAWLAGPLVLAILVFGSKFWITPNNNMRILRGDLSYTLEELEKIEAGLRTSEASTLQALRAAADDEDLRALNYLGLLHDPTSDSISKGVQRNPDSALAYYEKASALGSVRALIYAGRMLSSIKQTDRACGYFQKAWEADPDLIEAKAQAGYCMATESNVSAEAKTKGIELMESAGASGFVRAYALLGVTYLFLTPPDVALGVANFEKSIANNVDDSGYSHYRLGSVYFRGEFGVPIDYKKAIFHFQKGYEQGSSSAAIDLSWIYSKGTHGAPIDFKKAFEYASFGAKNGEVVGYHNLGIFYLQGKGVPRNDSLAAKHLLMAISLGYKDSLEYLKTATFSSDFIRSLQTRLAKAVMYYGPVDGKGNADLIRSLESLLNSRRQFE